MHCCENVLTRQVRARSAWTAAIACLAALVAAGCGGSWGNIFPPNTEFLVGVSVAGLEGSGLVLQDNGGDDLGVTANTDAFGTLLTVGQTYNVTVKTQPVNPTQVCTVSDGTGTVNSNGIDTVYITCATQSFAVGGTIQVLLGSGLTLEDNGGDVLAVGANGRFTFPSAVASGQPYVVTVKTQPSNPAQVCNVMAGSGTVTSGPVTSVLVSCAVSQLSLIAGRLGGAGNTDGSGIAARFNQPYGPGIDAAGNLYVADWSPSIRKITPAAVVSTLPGANPHFDFPRDVAADSAGNLYVADSGNNVIRKITPAGVVTTFAGSGVPGSADGLGSAASFNNPSGVAVGPAGDVYVADTYNCTVRHITAAGAVTTLAGIVGMQGSTDGPAATATFSAISSIAVDAAGNVYIADPFNDAIRKLAAGVVSTLAGTAGVRGAADGTGSAAQFNGPSGVAVDAAGTIYVADTQNSTIRAVTVGGVVTTLAGTPGILGNSDGVGSAARFSYPTSVVVDPAGTVYVADGASIRKIAIPGSSVTTLVSGQFRVLSSLALDAGGNIYASDWQASTISKVTSAGVVTTLAGATLQYGWADGTGAAARFASPEGIAVDSAGNVYVADLLNQVIRRITSAGVVSTIVGVPFAQGVVLGTLPASLNRPYGVAVLPGPGVHLAISSQAENAILRADLP